MNGSILIPSYSVVVVVFGTTFCNAGINSVCSHIIMHKYRKDF